MNQQPKHPAKSQGLKHKLWVAYFLLSVIPTLFIIYLISQGAAGNFSMTNPQLIPLAIGIGALILMSISALIILYRSVTSLENITQKTIRLVKENTNVNLLMDTNDETEKLNTCFMEMVKEVQHKINEVNKYAVALGETNKKLSQMAIKDGLTQLYNQIYIKERLENELKRADQFNQYISIMMLDIDDFKKYNDFYGHLAGDNCLKSISGLIKENCREIDIPARYGGEEFIMLISGNLKVGRESALRLRRVIENHLFISSTAPPLRNTVSIGVASFPLHGKTCTEVIGAADQALYEAKEQGRNRVVCFEDESGIPANVNTSPENGDS